MPDLLLHLGGRFLDVGGLQRAKIIGRLQALAPGRPIHVGERLQLRIGEKEVHRLRLIDPFLTARRRIDTTQPAARLSTMGQ